MVDRVLFISSGENKSSSLKQVRQLQTQVQAISSGYITTSIELAAEWPILGLLAARSLFTLIPYYQHVGSSLLNEQ